jgi:predicted RNA binding protein YcfA (HicA-like mRNA interferase family)
MAPGLKLNMRYSNDKTVSALVRTLVRSGWQYVNGKTHGKLVAPNGRRLAVPGTPSDWRASLNFRRDIRRIAAIK